MEVIGLNGPEVEPESLVRKPTCSPSQDSEGRCPASRFLQGPPLCTWERLPHTRMPLSPHFPLHDHPSPRKHEEDFTKHRIPQKGPNPLPEAPGPSAQLA